MKGLGRPWWLIRMVAMEARVSSPAHGAPVATSRRWLSLRVRLFLAFVLPLLALAGIGLLSMGQLEQATHGFAGVANDNLMRLNHIEAVGTSFAQLRALELEHLVANDSQRQATIDRQIAENQRTLKDNLTAYQNVVEPSSRSVAFPLLEQRYNSYFAIHDSLMRLSSTGQQDQALQVYSSSEDTYSSLLADTRALREQESTATQAAASHGYSVSLHSRDILVAGLLVAAALVFAAGLWLSGFVQRRVTSLLAVIRRVSQGDFSEMAESEGRDDFATLGRAFNAMTSSLKATEDENSRLNAEAMRLKEERIALLQDALKRSVEVQENERHRIARELHDQVGQSLAILQLGLSRLQKTAPTKQAAATLSQVREMALEALSQVRNLSLDLRPGMLDDAGLVSTLREYAQRFAERAGIAVEVAAGDWQSRLSPELEVTVFRVVQEAMTNVAKHAGAARVRIGVDRAPDALEVSVHDDGKGFEVEEALKGQRRKSLGLFGMEERCRLSGGAFDISSRPGEGTTVRCRWRLSAASV